MKRLFVAHKSLILSLLFIFLFSVTVSFASPLYNSQNTTLNPQCAPTDPDCTVQQSSWDTVNGSISSTGNVSVGTSTVDLNNKLNVVGGALFDNATVTTSLVIPQMPTVANQAASKGYVDSSLDGVKTFPQTTEAPIMSNPPVVTFGDSSAPTTISGGTLVPMTNSAFRYSGADVVQGNSYPNDLFYGATGLNSTYGVLPFQVEFTFTGTEFEIFQKSGGEYRLVVDGERVTERYQSGGPNDGSLRYRKIVFSSRKTRHIRLEMSYMAFGGIVIHPSDTIAPPTTPKGKRAIFLGDSFTEPADGYANTTSRMLGWEGWESGSGGTGYVNPGIAPGRVNFTNRVQTDVIDHNPDVVVIAGGINDGNDAQLQTNAEYVFSQIRSQLPNTKLIVVGPWWPTGTPNSDILAARDKIQTAAAAYGAVFIDPIAEHWITGQRTDCSTGNACLYTSDDNTHPTQVGHDYLGMRLAQKILQLAPETTSVSTALSAGSLSSAGGTLSGRLSLSSKAGTDTLLTNRLVVNTPGTADTLAETLFTVSANTHKALVLQGTTSQSANLQEWQNVSGTVMASLSGAGNLALGVSTITPDSAKLIVKGDAGKTAAKFQTSDSSGSVVQFLQASGNYVIGDIYAENGGGRLTINSESGGSGVQLGASYDTPFLNIIRSSTSGRSNFINFKTRNSSDWYIGSDFNDDTLFRFRRNSTDFAVISDVGNLGIGTTTPTSKLFVQNTDGSLPGLTIKAASGQGAPLFSLVNSTGSTIFAIPTLSTAYGATNLVAGISAGASIAPIQYDSQVYGTITGGSANTIFGNYAGANLVDGNENTLIGFNAGYGLIGADGGDPNFVGSLNTMIGANSGGNLQTGVANVGVGQKALSGLTTGQRNVAMGKSSLATITTQSWNVALGSESQKYATGSYNVTIGASAGAELQQNGNIAIGNLAAGDARYHNLYRTFIAGADTPGFSIDDVYFGQGKYSAAPTPYTIHATDGYGTNVAGADLQFSVGTGTGNASGGSIKFKLAQPTSSGSDFQYAYTKMILTPSGYLGVGTDTPSDTLHLLSYAGRTGVRIQNGAGTNPGDFVLSTSNNENLGGGKLLFQDGVTGTSYMTLTNAGYLGIATTTPSYTLSVGNSTISGIVSSFQNSTGTCTINPTTTALSCSSDRNLKKDITVLDTNTLNKVLSLQPVTYHWNTESSTDSTHAGFIAQEVEAIFPDLVSTDPKTGLKSLAYTGLIPYTVKAIQDINITVTSLADTTKSNSLRDSLVAWLGSAGNGIGELFSKKVTTDQLCVGSTCVSQEEFLQIVQHSKQEAGEPAVVPQIVPEQPVTVLPEPQPETAPEPVVVSPDPVPAE